MTFQLPQQAGSPENGSTATGAVPWARAAVASGPPITERRRRIVQGLPAWDPLPPGEILVHRQRQD